LYAASGNQRYAASAAQLSTVATQIDSSAFRLLGWRSTTGAISAGATQRPTLLIVLNRPIIAAADWGGER
jgi:hypothetical protein